MTTRNNSSQNNTTGFTAPTARQAQRSLRPNTSSIGSSTYNPSKDLVGILSPLQNNKYTVKNSKSIADKIRQHSLDPDEFFISFDVVFLFRCIPSSLALKIAKERLQQDTSLHERTDISLGSIMKLLEFVLNNNYFMYQGSHYQQVFGCPMGSPVSAILASLHGHGAC